MSVPTVAATSVSPNTQTYTRPATVNDATGTGPSNPDGAVDHVTLSPAAKALATQGTSADPDHDGK
jgi:hypothetical protein